MGCRVRVILAYTPTDKGAAEPLVRFKCQPRRYWMKGGWGMCLGQGGLNKSARVKLSAHIHSYAHIRDYHILRRRESSIYTCVGRVVLTLTPIFSYENNVSSGTGVQTCIRDIYPRQIPYSINIVTYETLFHFTLVVSLSLLCFPRVHLHPYHKKIFCNKKS